LKPTISLPGLLDDLEAGLDALGVEIDRLFAEDRLAGAGEALDQVGMGVGRRADDDGVDILGGEDRVDGADVAAILIGNRLRRGGHGVGHGHQLGRSIPRHRLGMDLANAPCPQKSASKAQGTIA
jgi:hypothetical protein